MTQQTRRDFTQVAFGVLQKALGEQLSLPQETRKINSSAGGKIGGKRRAEKLSPEKRSEIAKQAALRRWKKTAPDSGGEAGAVSASKNQFTSASVTGQTPISRNGSESKR